MPGAAGALLALGLAAALAVAGPVSNDAPPVDTDVTPDARGKDAPGWKQVGGLVFASGELVAESPTVAEDDLYAVEMETTLHGFAGGSRTIDCGGVQTKVPVLYRYSDSPERGLSWTESLLGSCDRPGYVGAIGFMPDGRALAVGGDGEYPLREPDYDAEGQGPGEPYGARNDQAGHARAWLWNGVAWCELGPGAECGELQQGMRGMTAVALDRAAVKEGGKVLGFAGALGQMWRWQGDGFDKRWDQNSTSADLADAAGFVFRVRKIRFLDGVSPPVAVAVTSGCCGPPLDSVGATGSGASLSNVPQLLVGNQAWWRRAKLGSTLPDAKPEALALHNRRKTLPDSYYSIVTGTSSSGGNIVPVSMVMAPGAPETPDETASAVTQPICINTAGPIGTHE